jgi:hypothetical protein
MFTLDVDAVRILQVCTTIIAIVFFFAGLKHLAKWLSTPMHPFQSFLVKANAFRHAKEYLGIAIAIAVITWVLPILPQ